MTDRHRYFEQLYSGLKHAIVYVTCSFAQIQVIARADGITIRSREALWIGSESGSADDDVGYEFPQ